MLSDNFKNGTIKLNISISLLFSSMLTHGVAPGGLLLSKPVPIPKNKMGNKSDSSNYRAIAISSLLGKIFDLIVLKEQCKSLEIDKLQFEFKQHSSTVICTTLSNYRTLLNIMQEMEVIATYYYLMHPRLLIVWNM